MVKMRTKRLLGILLALVMMAGLLPLGQVAYASSGTGTMENPLIVTTPEELKDALDNDNIEYVKLGSDIDLASTVTSLYGTRISVMEKDRVVDLNGYQLTHYGLVPRFYNSTQPSASHGNLTIKDSSSAGTGKIITGNGFGINVYTFSGAEGLNITHKLIIDDVDFVYTSDGNFSVLSVANTKSPSHLLDATIKNVNVSLSSDYSSYIYLSFVNANESDKSNLTIDIQNSKIESSSAHNSVQKTNNAEGLTSADLSYFVNSASVVKIDGVELAHTADPKTQGKKVEVITTAAPTTVKCTNYWGSSSNDAMKDVKINNNPLTANPSGTPVNLTPGETATITLKNASGWNNTSFFLYYNSQINGSNYSLTDNGAGVLSGTFIVPDFDFSIGINQERVSDAAYAATVEDLNLGTANVGYNPSAFNTIFRISVTGTDSLNGDTDHLKVELTAGDTTAFGVWVNNSGTFVAGTIDVGGSIRPDWDLTAGTYTATYTLYYDEDGNGTAKDWVALDSKNVTFTVTGSGETVKCTNYWVTTGPSATDVKINNNLLTDSPSGTPVNLTPGTTATITLKNASGWNNTLFCLRYNDQNYGSYSLTDNGSGVLSGTFTVPDVDFKIGIDAERISTDTYTVSFNGNGGGGTMADVTGVPAGSYTLPACGFTAPSTDKEFDKWSVKIGSAEPIDKQPNDTIQVTDNTTVTAVWKDKAAYKKGDVDNSGKVDGVDKAILNRYLAGWEGYKEKILNWDAADIDGNGDVNGRDKAILNRYLAGWEGYDSYFN